MKNKIPYGYCQCGCGNRSQIAKRNRKELGHIKGVPVKFIQGHSSKKHGLSDHQLYSVWLDMKSRCSNPNNKRYKDYGGRGIRVCLVWQNSFKEFYAFAISHGWKPNLQIDRKNNNTGYSPSNCIFVSLKTNTRNSRKSKIWVINDVPYQSCRSAAKALKVDHATIRTWCNGAKQNCFSYNKY